LDYSCKKIIGKLLYMANTLPYNNAVFYPLKNRLLKKYGTLLLPDLQHIKKICRNCDGSGLWNPYRKETCRHCGGSGIYEEFWVILDKYEIGGYEFYCPRERQHELKALKGVPVDAKIIEGFINHNIHPKYKKAYYLLLLLFDTSSLFKIFYQRVASRIKHLIRKVALKFRKKETFNGDIPF
jgi:hypothetical protein